MKRVVFAVIVSVCLTAGISRAFTGASSSSTTLYYNVEPAINFTTWANGHGVTDLSDGEQSTRGVANWLDYQLTLGWKLVAYDSANARYIFQSVGRPTP